MKHPLLILSALLVSSAAACAQAPAAPPAPENLLGDLKLDMGIRTTQFAPIPPGTKKLEVSATVSCLVYKPAPLSGAGTGVWVTFLNSAGEQLSPQGTVAKGESMAGFSLGVSRKTTKPVTDKRTVAVPPGATQIQVMITEYTRRGILSAWNTPKIEALSAKVVP